MPDDEDDELAVAPPVPDVDEEVLETEDEPPPPWPGSDSPGVMPKIRLHAGAMKIAAEAAMSSARERGEAMPYQTPASAGTQAVWR